VRDSSFVSRPLLSVARVHRVSEIFYCFQKNACHTTPFVVYILTMMRSWANSRSRRFYEQGKTSKFGGMDTDVAEDLLAILDAAESLKDISPLKSVGLHKLSGNRAAEG